MLTARPALRAGQRQVPDRAHRDHAGHGAHFPRQPVAELRVVRRPVVQLLLRRRDPQHQHVPGIEPRVDAEEPGDAHEHHAGAGEHDQRQRDLDGHQPIAQPALAVTGRAAPVLPHRAGEIVAERRERRRQAEQDAASDRDRRREGEHPDVDGHGIHRTELGCGNARRQQRPHRSRAPVGDQQSTDAAGAGEHEALGQQLPHDAPRGRRRAWRAWPARVSARPRAPASGWRR